MDEETLERCWEREGQAQWKWKERGKNKQEKWHGELEEGRIEGETDGDVNLFAEALTVLILNKEVNLIRFI